MYNDILYIEMIAVYVNKKKIKKVVDLYQPMGKANPDDPHELDKFVGDKTHVRAIVDKWNKAIGIDHAKEWDIKVSTFTDYD